MSFLLVWGVTFASVNKEVDYTLIFVHVCRKPYVHSSYGAILNTLKHQVLKTLFLCNFMITKIWLFFCGWWCLRTFYLHTVQLRFTVDNSGLCCTHVARFKRRLTPLFISFCDYKYKYYALKVAPTLHNNQSFLPYFSLPSVEGVGWWVGHEVGVPRHLQ